MTNLMHRDQKRRLLFSQFEIKRIQCKALLQNSFLKDSIKKELGFHIKEMPRNSSKTRIRRRCTLTGRGRGVLRVCKISRIRFRELAAQGAINGINKASW